MWCVWFIKIKKRQLFFVHILHNSVSRSLKPCWPNKHQQTFDMTLPQASEVIPFWAVISYFPFPSCLHRHVPIPQKLWFLLAVFPVCDIQTGIDGARGYVCVVHRLWLTLCHLLAACECQGASGHSPAHHWFTCFPSCPCAPFYYHWLRPGEGNSLCFLLARSPSHLISLTPSGGDHHMLMWQEHNTGCPPSVECRLLPPCHDLWLSPGVIRQGQQPRVSPCSVRGPER